MGIGLVLLGTFACSTRAAEKLIDPRLREQGQLLEREGRGQDRVYGAYRVVGLERHELGAAGAGALTAEAGERTRPTQAVTMAFELVGPGETWQVACEGQRRQPPDYDYAGVADEQRDEVALHCTLVSDAQAPGAVLRVEGKLSNNLLGELVAGDRRREVEVVMWHRLWNITRRHLPASLVSVRSLDGAETDAALIMTAREQIVVRTGLDEHERGLVLAAALAIRLMPLGFDT